MTDDDYRQIIYSGSLNRGQIAKACGFGKSALTQNPKVRGAFELLEKDLRESCVLPPLTDSAKKAKSDPKPYDNTATKRIRESKRIAELEQEVVELRARLKRFEELSAVLTEMGMDL